MFASTDSRRFAAAVVACTAAAVSLAGCGSSAKANTSASAATGGGSSSTAPAKPGSGGSGQSGGNAKGPVDVCALIPPATLSQLTGKQFTHTEADNTASYGIYACNYTSDVSAQGINQLRLDVLTKGGKVGLDADVSAAKQVGNGLTNLTPVSGIGDKAYGGGIQAHIEVLYGDELIKISGATDITTDQGKQIVSQLHSKL